MSPGLAVAVRQLQLNFHNQYFSETLATLWPGDAVVLNKRQERLDHHQRGDSVAIVRA